MLTRLAPIAAVLVAWELVARTGFVNPYVFPPVSEILLRWVELFADGRIYLPLWETLWRALAGLALAILVGVPLGLLMGRVRWAEWFFEPLFSFGFPLPKIALIPLYVHWFGLFSLSKVMLIFTDCLFPMVLFTYHGARGLSPIYLWSAQSRGTGRVRMLWRVVLPLSAASIYDGVQVAVVVAVLVAVVSEMVSGGSGLGQLMIRSYRFGDVRTAFATLLTISLIGYALYKGAQWLRERLLFWHVADV
ncbi:MAG TPA: ABC transporter permease [Burkholderiales bacterium]|nr:ABC transporter permease [Burkholderiales bacterium]